jgi:predicted membrane protein
VLFLYVFLKVFTFIFNQLEIIFNLFSFFCCYLKSLAYICQTINNNTKDKQKQNKMYQVTKTTHIAGQPIRTDWSYEFNDENKAINCLMEHAAYNSLDNIREDLYYASSDGIKPEIEIEIVQYS